MKLNWVQIAISLVLGFALGITFNCLKCKKCCFVKDFKHKAHKEQMVDRFSKKLELTPDQQTQVGKIFEEKHLKIKELKASTETKIKTILTTEQIEKFDEMQAKWKNKFKEPT